MILRFPEPGKSAEKIIALMEKFTAKGVEMLAFPEVCLCGYACDPAYWQEAVPAAFAREKEKVVVTAGRLRLGVVLATAHWAGAFPVLDLAAKCRERLLAFGEETV